MSRRRSRSGWPRWASCIRGGSGSAPSASGGRVDATDAVAAEVSAVQNISHARAVGQVHYARTLRERLPRVAKVFARG